MITVFLSLEPYLAQWFIHESGGITPVPIKRNSPESDILAANLKPQPKDLDYSPQTDPGENEITIQLPCFKYKDIRTYNYLDSRGKILLKHCIRTRFICQLWRDLMTVRNVTRRTDLSISEWMKDHGIEYNDRNWNAIAKILQRKKAIYAPLKEKKEKIDPTSFHFCPPVDSPNQE